MIRERTIDSSKVRNPLELADVQFLPKMGIAFLYLFGTFEDYLNHFSDIDLA